MGKKYKIEDIEYLSLHDLYEFRDELEEKSDDIRKEYENDKEFFAKMDAKKAVVIILLIIHTVGSLIAGRFEKNEIGPLLGIEGAVIGGTILLSTTRSVIAFLITCCRQEKVSDKIDIVKSEMERRKKAEDEREAKRINKKLKKIKKA